MKRQEAKQRECPENFFYGLQAALYLEQEQEAKREQKARLSLLRCCFPKEQTHTAF